MALQSQTRRDASSTRSSMSQPRRRSSAGRLITAAALLAAAGFGGWYLYTHRADANPLGPQAAKAAPAPLITEPEPAPIAAAPAPAPAAPQYEVLEMSGRPRSEHAAASAPSNNAGRPNFAVNPASGPTLLGTPAAVVGSEPIAPTPSAPAPAVANTAPPAGGKPAGTTPAVRDPLAPGAQPAPAGAPGALPLPAMGASGAMPAELTAVQQLAERLIAEKKPVEARAQLNKVVTDARLSDAQRDSVRRRMAELNNDLVFSATAYPGDPMVETYQVAKGDNFIKISQKLNTVTEAGLIQRVSGANPKTLRIGQPLKIVRGPFHTVVSKSAFRMDLYWGPSVSPGAIGQSNLGGGAEPGWVYIRSFPVGLGEKGTTPIGAFTLKDRSKLINPPWVNPRTGEKFGADDPKNPIGERWMGLVGLDEKTKSYQGYGIHGTIVPESIGQEMSMGCVRMATADVELVYELLMERVSIVKIVP